MLGNPSASLLLTSPIASLAVPTHASQVSPPLAELLTVLVLEGGDDSAPPASAVRWSSQASSEALKGAACNGCKQLRGLL